MLVTMKCPSCGADLQIDNAREFMFCQFCGTKIANLTEKIEISGNVSLDNSARITNLLQRAKEHEKLSKIGEAIGYYNQVLDLDINCAEARQGIDRCNVIITEPNVTISFKTLFNNYILQTSIDNKMITKYRNGDSYAFTLPVGKHIVKFRIGSHRYSRAIIVKDRSSKFNILYTQDGRNHIDIC